MEIRAATFVTTGTSPGTGTVTFGQPFPNAIDFVVAMFWDSHNSPGDPNATLPTANPTVGGFSFADPGHVGSLVTYLAVGH
jgi:hypothetical protein